jgi:hypothetical protein
MTRREKLYRRAAECLAFAEKSIDPGVHQFLVVSAASWHDLADRAAEYLGPEQPRQSRERNSDEHTDTQADTRFL